MRHATKTATIELDEVTIHTNEVITIWLVDDTLKYTQVELRVTSDGKKEIYCSKDIIKPFSKWHRPDDRS